MADGRRRDFLRGAAGFGSAGLIPRIGWAAAGVPTYPGGGRVAPTAASACWA